jgi:outer membrane protein insertion porin family
VAHNLQLEASWRNLNTTDGTSAFAVREQCGHSLKSALRHILCVDRRDNPVFPTEGSLFKLSQEYAGLGGDIGFFKNELETQANIPLSKFPGVVIQAQ